MDSTVKKGKLQGGEGKANKESLPRRSRKKHERVSGRNSSGERCAEPWFYSKSGQT